MRLQKTEYLQYFSELVDTLIFLFVSAQSVALPKYRRQNGRSKFRASSDIVGNPVPIPSPNAWNDSL